MSPPSDLALDTAASRGGADGNVRIRPLRSGEEDEVRRIFRTTLLLGQPLPFEDRTLAGYSRLCLDWYLTRGMVLVADVDGQVRGYLLACLDQPSYERWSRRRAAIWGLRAAARIAFGACRGPARRFAWLRIRDGLATARSAPDAPMPAHAHLNLDPEIRAGATGHRLVAAMDAIVEAAGLPGWFGEMNVPPGRSLAAIERAGAVVVHRQPNRTFSWLLASPVERTTIVRALATRTDSVVRR
jgi:hypothetical protein